MPQQPKTIVSLEKQWKEYETTTTAIHKAGEAKKKKKKKQQASIPLSTSMLWIASTKKHNPKQHRLNKFIEIN